MKGILGGAGLGLLPRPVLVVGILLQVQQPESLCLADVRRALLLRQDLPPAAETLGDLGVVHVRRHFDDLPALDLRPDHEGVHRPLHVIRRLLALSRVGVGSRRRRVHLERPEVTAAASPQNRRRGRGVGSAADAAYRRSRRRQRLQVDSEGRHFFGAFLRESFSVESSVDIGWYGLRAVGRCWVCVSDRKESSGRLVLWFEFLFLVSLRSDGNMKIKRKRRTKSSSTLEFESDTSNRPFL